MRGKMKKILFILLICLLSVLSALDIKNLEIREKSKNYDQAGNLISFYLIKPQMIQGFPCKNYIHLYPSGKLKGIELSDDIVFQGMDFELGSKIEFYESGELHLVLFTKNRFIQGYPIIAYGPEGPMVEFYQNGKLKYFTLSEDTDIQKIPCRAGAFSEIYLHPNGRLLKCELSEPVIINNIQYNARDILLFDDQGKISEKQRNFFMKRNFLDFLDLFL